MKRLGQVSVDYLITVILLSLVALVVITAYQENERSSFESMRTLQMKDIADTVSDKINDVLVMGNGSRSTTVVPFNTSRGTYYNLSIKGNAVLLRWGEADYASRFMSSGINGSNSSSTIVLQPGRIILWNDNGTIYIKNDDEWSI
jgi:hypothetical protein